MPNFSSVALFVQKLFRWGIFTPPQLFNVHKKAKLGRGKIPKEVVVQSKRSNSIPI